MLGWSRIVQIVGFGLDGTPRCRNAWVRQQGAHRVVIDDELDVDYGGLWFASWPQQMRAPKDAYARIDLPVRQVRSKTMGRPREPFQEEPSDLLAEATASLRNGKHCGSDNDGRAAISLLRAAWVRALGHTELARRMMIRWNLPWPEQDVRDQLARAMHHFTDEGRRQGMPRAQLRRWLERTAAMCDCRASSHAAEQLALLGDDPSGPIDPSDPQALLAWLADDLVFPLQRYDPDRARYRTGWSPQTMPRSPALELYALGWSALPALVESPAPARLMRLQLGPTRADGNPTVTTTLDARRSIASLIALRRFADDDEMRAWWAAAEPGGELAAHMAALELDDDFTEQRVRRLLALDHVGALARIDGALAGLSPRVRLHVVAAVVEQLPQRRWVDHAIAAVRAQLDAPGSVLESENVVVDLLVAVARADPRRGAALLREVSRRERTDDRLDVAQYALSELCEPEKDEPMPDCRPQLRRMFDAVSSRP
jgi:hypothetical protein